jgi:hypothetical protein
MPTKKKKHIWLWIVLALVVLLILGLLWVRSAVKNASTLIYKSYTVASGSVETTVTAAAGSPRRTAKRCSFRAA